MAGSPAEEDGGVAFGVKAWLCLRGTPYLWWLRQGSKKQHDPLLFRPVILRPTHEQRLWVLGCVSKLGTPRWVVFNVSLKKGHGLPSKTDTPM